MRLDRKKYEELIETRIYRPVELLDSLRRRERRSIPGSDGKLLMIAADHTARGKLALGDEPLAMSDRYTLLERLVRLLSMPEVDGVLGSADVLEELAWLGALEGKLAIGTMNRGGIIGADWELDDRLSAYDVDHIEKLGLDGGKTLLRIDYQNASVPRTLETVARLTTELADRSLLAMIEPLPYRTNPQGKAELDPSVEELVKIVAIASGLGSISAHTWLKIPASARMAEVAGATSLPILMLGGEPKVDSETIFELWEKGMCEPNVRGIIAGRTLLYPLDENPEGAVLRASNVLRPPA